MAWVAGDLDPNGTPGYVCARCSNWFEVKEDRRGNKLCPKCKLPVPSTPPVQAIGRQSKLAQPKPPVQPRPVQPRPVQPPPKPSRDRCMRWTLWLKAVVSILLLAVCAWRGYQIYTDDSATCSLPVWCIVALWVGVAAHLAFSFWMAYNVQLNPGWATVIAIFSELWMAPFLVVLEEPALACDSWRTYSLIVIIIAYLFLASGLLLWHAVYFSTEPKRNTTDLRSCCLVIAFVALCVISFLSLFAWVQSSDTNDKAFAFGSWALTLSGIFGADFTVELIALINVWRFWRKGQSQAVKQQPVLTKV